MYLEYFVPQNKQVLKNQGLLNRTEEAAWRGSHWPKLGQFKLWNKEMLVMD